LNAVLALLRRFRIDPYLVLILAMVALASLLPVRGGAAQAFDWATKGAIALLFFLHGARLSRQSVLMGLIHWRLHATVLAATFVLFPLLGLAAQLTPHAILSPPLAAGVLFLCCLPSTVQSSIAFVGIARGNIAAAVVAASASNLIGIVLTPLLATLLLHTGPGGGVTLGQVEGIVLQLLLPFVLGQLASPLIGPWVQRHRQPLGWYDRSTILMVVYGAFSAAVVEANWARVSLLQLLAIVAASGLILAVMLAATAWGARALGFSKEDEITIVMCGSKKSLASGAPIAGILFPPASVGLILLPLMIFHQIQLMACAALAQRYAQRPELQPAETPAA
jgi:sodium/bile acid cotransporter 7